MTDTIWAMNTPTRSDRAARVGNEVRRLRRAMRLTQSELGEAAGVTQSYISDIEKGEHVPEPDKIDALADQLKIPRYRLRALAGYTGMDDPMPDDREAELVGAYRRADEEQREQVLRAVRALLGSSG